MSRQADADTRARIAAAARGYAAARVPFRRQGRDPRFGIDCGGLVKACGWAAGLPVPNALPTYRSVPAPSFIDEELARFADPVPLAEADEGDIVRFEVHGRPVHLGILTGGGRVAHVLGVAPRGTHDEALSTLPWPVVAAYRFRSA
ncbi:NlpC/P60 family protein [Roseomonas sp. GC11]|uniref:NlpC/P60 family protein n=1 Tax=Roseomonas sp. GC11 TaxID=2950546 RepID=UPI00210EA048|nr:NlpC/P60 family protein [Roseomonas sp. GC11]MCQ4160857.1 NlpC/P60 family protein [Roseomonas sp. GC11]